MQEQVDTMCMEEQSHSDYLALSAIRAKLPKLNVKATGGMSQADLKSGDSPSHEDSGESANRQKSFSSETSKNGENSKASSSVAMYIPSVTSTSEAGSSSSESSDEEYIAQLATRSRSHFRNEGSVHELYSPGKCLGSGGTSTVCVGNERSTGDQYAVKIMNLPESGENTTNTRESVLSEIDILASLQHETVVKLKEYFDEDDKIYIVTELLSEEDLIMAIAKRPDYSEEDARLMFSKLLAGINYLHTVGIAHRDLKPANLVFKDPKDFSSVKIIDFGFAKKIAQDIYSPKGTPQYLAPEILCRAYHAPDLAITAAIDLWSAGVILYELLGGDQPFQGKHRHDDKVDRKLRQAILNGAITFDGPAWEHVTDAAKDLVSKLLNPDPNTRLTAKEALEHPWILGTSQGYAQSTLKVTRDKVIKSYQKI